MLANKIETDYKVVIFLQCSYVANKAQIRVAHTNNL